jgi:hypothetical protein
MCCWVRDAIEEAEGTEGIDDEEHPEGASDNEGLSVPQDGGDDAWNIGEGNQGPEMLKG